MWLSLAVLAWAVSGVIDIFYAFALRNTSSGQAIDPTNFDAWRSLVSLINSAFILLALPCFKHIPKIINPIIKSPYWRFWVLITFIFSAIATLLLWGVSGTADRAFIYSVDVFYAVFTLIFLGLVIWASFEKRGLKTLAYLSAICIACTLIAQLFKLDDSDFLKVFFSCTFKTILIMLFFAVTLSWIQELSKTFIPKPKDLHLVFNKKKNGLNKFEHNVVLTIPPKIQTQQISFTEKNYELFLKFAQKRVQAQQEKDAWLEMQPKSNINNKEYDLRDYNQINRILDTILNDVYGAENWTAENERNHLKQVLFEYKNRKIRLNIAPENITTQKA